eukprot:CAMPEP_0185371548 /NCGR_PEP_ID=MMETSP1364-20130426/22581_1 /TAXON_ID=38817 /ORGANISM="Gephyrocapsa oceanica, Strain RCC1303" /LENGTH=129 /DNA_ID=CAMNT_0027972419 /DNA_START=206 /DNA_END=591 /DNA_ORIENTATION=+
MVGRRRVLPPDGVAGSVEGGDGGADVLERHEGEVEAESGVVEEGDGERREDGRLRCDDPHFAERRRVVANLDRHPPVAVSSLDAARRCRTPRAEPLRLAADQRELALGRLCQRTQLVARVALARQQQQP